MPSPLAASGRVVAVGEEDSEKEGSYFRIPRRSMTLL
jgi:hypothetical protein